MLAVLFFAIPVAVYCLLGYCIHRYRLAQWVNRETPGAYSEKEIKTRKAIMILAVIGSVVFTVVVVGFVVLLYLAIAYM